jgi:sugar transferase (PEP-CTERM/EpsH1 system associated)
MATHAASSRLGDDAMRCLVLSPFVPYPPEDGGRIRIYELLSRLSQRHRVDVLALAECDDSLDAVHRLREEGYDVDAVPHRLTPSLRTGMRAVASGRSLYGTVFASRRFADVLQARLHADAYDIVQCEFAYMALYAPVSHANGGPRWVLDSHNVEFRLNETLASVTNGLSGALYRPYAAREARLRRREELAYCRRVDRVLTVSATDRAALREAVPGLVVDVIPNGVDLDRFAPSERTESDRSPGAVFVGKMDYRPNVEGIHWFCEEVLPLVRRRLPEFTLTICGSRPTAAVRRLSELDGVRVTGRIADPRPYLDDAAVVVVPLRAGSGTRLKVLEALAMGRPVLTTSLGAEGLELEPGTNVAQADDAPTFCDRLVSLAEDPFERARLGAAGRRVVEERYGWSAAIARLEAVYAELVDDPRTDEP